VTKQTQADTEIHEDQPRNFLVNTLTGAFGISIAGNADIDPEDIYYSEAKRGTTAFHAYATLYARLKESTALCVYFFCTFVEELKCRGQEQRRSAAGCWRARVV
jgi:hypothetical protein